MGKEYEVDIKETSRQGEGIARIQGFVIFVPNAKLGDHLKIKITRIGRRAANAEIVK
jgi:predicted RNA-binding protein with TRAM domain